jgi:Glycosyltransferase family 87
MTGGTRAAASAGAAAAITWLTWLTLRDHSALAARYPLLVEAALWAGFAAGAWLILRTGPRRAIPIILLGGLAIQLAALSAPPKSSDDLYRYIWDGRVQASGIDPYQYVPAATQLTGLRDAFLWPATGPHCVTARQAAARPLAALSAGCTRINRPTVHTIYPPVAEAYFAGVYELSGGRGGAKPIQAAAAICALGTTILLLFGLRWLGRDPRLAVFWAWCPVVGLEAGNSAHIDVLAAFLVVAALLVLSRPGRRRAIAGGALLGLAIATKITPVVVAPAVLRRHPVAVATSAAGAIGIVYLPHLIVVGGAVIGFLPGYLNEEGYSGGSRFELLSLVMPQQWSAVAAAAVLAAASIAVLRFGDPARPWRGAVLMTGTALLVTTPFYGWYTLVLVALVAIDGRPEWLAVAAARYLTPAHPWPGVTLPGQVRVGYAAALAVVLAASLIRRRNQPPATPNGEPEIRLDDVAADRSSLDAVQQDQLGPQSWPARR